MKFYFALKSTVVVQYTINSTVGPFLELNAEQVEEEQDNMWRTMHKLSKGFGDLPNPKRSAESIKMRLQKFKENMPLIHIFCNPGIRDRHWQIVREFDITMKRTYYIYIYKIKVDMAS